MWIALNDGFLSVVEADMNRLPKREIKNDRGTGMLTVRARKPEHLTALFPGRKVYVWKARDYPARIFIAREDMAEFIAKRITGIDYGNFKNSVDDNPLHDAYMQVWSVMHRYQYGGFNPRPYSPLQTGFNWHDDRYRPGFINTAPFGDDLDDDVPCGRQDCTEEMRCLDCMMDALACDPDSNLYGAFDSGEEADEDEGAVSHLRVPPR